MQDAVILSLNVKVYDILKNHIHDNFIIFFCLHECVWYVRVVCRHMVGVDVHRCTHMLTHTEVIEGHLLSCSINLSFIPLK